VAQIIMRRGEGDKKKDNAVAIKRKKLPFNVIENFISRVLRESIIKKRRIIEELDKKRIFGRRKTSLKLVENTSGRKTIIKYMQ